MRSEAEFKIRKQDLTELLVVQHKEIMDIMTKLADVKLTSDHKPATVHFMLAYQQAAETEKRIFENVKKLLRIIAPEAAAGADAGEYVRDSRLQ